MLRVISRDLHHALLGKHADVACDCVEGVKVTLIVWLGAAGLHHAGPCRISWPADRRMFVRRNRRRIGYEGGSSPFLRRKVASAASRALRACGLRRRGHVRFRQLLGRVINSLLGPWTLNPTFHYARIEIDLNNTSPGQSSWGRVSAKVTEMRANLHGGTKTVRPPPRVSTIVDKRSQRSQCSLIWTQLSRNQLLGCVQQRTTIAFSALCFGWLEYAQPSCSRISPPSGYTSSSSPNRLPSCVCQPPRSHATKKAVGARPDDPEVGTVVVPPTSRTRHTGRRRVPHSRPSRRSNR